MFGTIIFILCFVLCIIFWDLQAKLRFFLIRKGYANFWNDFFRQMSSFAIMLARFYAGLKFKIEYGIPYTKLPERFILVTNHQSLADIATLVCAFPQHNLKYAAKKELKWGIPSVSVGLRLGNHAFVNRKGSFSETERSIKKLLNCPGSRICPVIFPEGTRSKTGELGRFHTAGLRILLENSNLPLVTAVIDGGHKIQKFKDFFTKLYGLEYRIKVLALYPHVSTKVAVQELLKKIKSDMEDQLMAWRKKSSASV